MEFIVSRNFLLPESRRALSEEPSYNLWSKKFWPYLELTVGDTLLWYESKSGRIVWRSEVTQVVRFEYSRKKEVANRLRLPREETDSVYFRNAASAGYCLAYKLKPQERLDV